MSHQTAIGRVKGLGSARSGSKQWLMQKVTAVVLAILFLWFAGKFALLIGKDYTEVVGWIQQPLTAVLLITFVFTAFYHAILGLQVFLEDYISKTCQRIIVVNAMRVIMMMFGLAAILAIIKIAVFA